MKKYLVIGLLLITAIAFGRTPDHGATDFTGTTTHTDIITKGPWIDVRAYGADPAYTGTVNSAAVLSALAALPSGGHLNFPSGKFKLNRGTGALIADTIVSDNITISGNGASTILDLYKEDGTTPNSVGNQYYNVFQATNRSNITIENLSFQGYGVLGYFDSCTNITIRNVTGEGLLPNAGGYLQDKGVYFYQSSDVKIIGNTFYNYQFAVYLSGDNTTRTSNVKISNNHFEHNTAAGSFTSLFPVGVYVFFGDDVIIEGNTFKDIYSSYDNGTTGTGVGFGVYEGDGANNKMEVVANTFEYTGNGSKNAIGIYINYSEQAIVSSNTIKSSSSGRLISAMRIDSKIATTKRIVSDNIMASAQTTISTFGIYVTGTSTTNVGVYDISNNTIDGFTNGIRVDGLGASSFSIFENKCISQIDSGIRLAGVAGTPIKFPKIHGNTISLSGVSGIYLTYVISASIIGNKILDGNTTGAAAEAGAAIRFTGFGFGSIISDNVIGNTPFGGGLFAYGIANANNASDRIFKDIIHGNAFHGFNVASWLYLRYNTVSPVSGIFDVEYGDFITNNAIDTGDPTGWRAIAVSQVLLTADASSVADTITVASTSGYVAGDIILLLKDNDPYDADYYTYANQHATSILSVGGGTFIIADSISAGDGTYTSGTAIVKRVRFEPGPSYIPACASGDILVSGGSGAWACSTP